MTHSFVSCPCGLSTADIIDIAGGMHRALTSLGLPGRRDIAALLMDVGIALTGTLPREAPADADRSFCDRVVREAGRAADVLMAPGAREACCAIGWTDRPRHPAFSWPSGIGSICLSLQTLETMIGASRSQMIDLVVWLQVAFLIPVGCGVAATSEASGPDPMGCRRDRRAMASRRRRRRRGTRTARP